jgi:hypothetical protein
VVAVTKDSDNKADHVGVLFVSEFSSLDLCDGWVSSSLVRQGGRTN